MRCLGCSVNRILRLSNVHLGLLAELRERITLIKTSRDGSDDLFFARMIGSSVSVLLNDVAHKGGKPPERHDVIAPIRGAGEGAYCQEQSVSRHPGDARDAHVRENARTQD